MRGGKDQFTWDSVKSDKDRECYLGHSLMAPVGRWQNGKDLTWYAKDSDKTSKVSAATQEFLKAKEMEEKALMAALGYKVVEKPPTEEQPKNDDEERESRKSSKKSRKHASSSDDESEKSKKHKMGPSVGSALSESRMNDTEELDRMLLKLINKYSIREIHEALGDSDYDKSSDNESDGKEKRHKSHKKSKKKHKKHKHHKSSKDPKHSDSD